MDTDVKRGEEISPRFCLGEKEQRWRSLDFADEHPANPVAGFSLRRRSFLPLRSRGGRGEGWGEGSVLGQLAHLRLDMTAVSADFSGQTFCKAQSRNCEMETVENNPTRASGVFDRLPDETRRMGDCQPRRKAYAPPARQTGGASGIKMTLRTHKTTQQSMNELKSIAELEEEYKRHVAELDRVCRIDNGYIIFQTSAGGDDEIALSRCDT